MREAAVEDVVACLQGYLMPVRRGLRVKTTLDHPDRIPGQIEAIGPEVNDVAERPKHHRDGRQIFLAERYLHAASELVPMDPAVRRIDAEPPVDRKAARPECVDDVVVRTGTLTA